MSSFQRLQKFQNRTPRINGVNYEVDSAVVLESLDWETLEERRIRDISVIYNGYMHALSLRDTSLGCHTATPGNYNLSNTDLASPKSEKGIS